MKQTNTLIVIEYVLNTESEDYLNWCLDENLDPIDYKNNKNHVWASAVDAYENETGLPVNIESYLNL